MRILFIKDYEYKTLITQSIKFCKIKLHVMRLQSHRYKQKFLQPTTIYDFNLLLTHVQIQLKSKSTPSRLDLRHK
jgi:hypothetical protein